MLALNRLSSPIVNAPGAIARLALLIAVTSSLGLVPIVAIAQADDRTGAIDVLLEDDIRSARERIRTLQAEVAEWNKVLVGLTAESSMSVEFPAGIAERVAELEDLLKRAGDSEDGEVTRFELARSIANILPGDEYDPQAAMTSAFNAITPTNSTAREALDSAFAIAASDFFGRSSDAREEWSGFGPLLREDDLIIEPREAIDILVPDSVFDDRVITPDESGEVATALSLFLNVEEVRRLYDLLDESYQDHRQAVLDSVSAEIDARNAEIETLRKSVGEKVKEFSKLRSAAAERQAIVDQRLVWAVYGMIVAAFLLFLSLKILPVDIAKLVLEKRSLVEIIGTAFMLVTIIILATGSHLSKEILGTLLGTIGGYIFGRVGLPQAKGD